MRLSQVLYAAMQIAIVGGTFWLFDDIAKTYPEAGEVGGYGIVILGGFFAMLATAAVYWGNRAVRRLLGKGNTPLAEAVFDRRLIDLSAFAPRRDEAAIGRRRDGRSKRQIRRRQ